MKKIIFLLTLVISSAFYQFADAQVSVRVNIGSQPVWGPAGYDYAEYYYFPDIDAYYNIPTGQYIYFNGYQWVPVVSLPGSYRNFDPYRAYKVVINEREPYLRNNYYRSTYARYRGASQPIIYNSHDPKYFVIQNPPEHNRYYAGNNNYDRRFDNDRRNDNDRRFDGDRRDDNDRRFQDGRNRDLGRTDDRDRRFDKGRDNDHHRGFDDGGRRN